MRFQLTDTHELRTLDFDIENRPLAYWYDEKTTAEVTAIAWSWEGEDTVRDQTLGLAPRSGPRMLEAFARAYEEADVVTGHYIRRHDLPLINGAMIEHGYEPLGPKLTSDTRLDLISMKDVSRSQESLAALYNLPQPKHHMTQAEWRAANRLTAEGVLGTRLRVVKDVKQHKALRRALVAADALKPPRIWTP